MYLVLACWINLFESHYYLFPSHLMLFILCLDIILLLRSLPFISYLRTAKKKNNQKVPKRAANCPVEKSWLVMSGSQHIFTPSMTFLTAVHLVLHFSQCGMGIDGYQLQTNDDIVFYWMWGSGFNFIRYLLVLVWMLYKFLFPRISITGPSFSVKLLFTLTSNCPYHWTTLDSEE